jgi:hypothetical protein
MRATNNIGPLGHGVSSPERVRHRRDGVFRATPDPRIERSKLPVAGVFLACDRHTASAALPCLDQVWRRRRHQPRSPPLAKIRSGRPAPAMRAVVPRTSVVLACIAGQTKACSSAPHTYSKLQRVNQLFCQGYRSYSKRGLLIRKRRSLFL